MKKITCLLLLFTMSVNAQTYSGPESVEYDSANSRWLIANTTSHEVLARNSAGILSAFASGLVSGPYGIEIMGNVLYCCSGASVKGFDLTTGANVFNLNVGATFLNGMTHDNSGNLYATDFSAKKIFKINPAASTFSAIATSLVQSPNGIVFDQANNRCVFANWGANAPIKAIDLTSFSVTTLLTTSYSNIDGIARDAAGNYYLSNWGSQSVVRYDSAFALPPVTIASGLSSPADIFVNTANILGIPNSGNNTVTFIDLNLGAEAFLAGWLKEINISPNPANLQANLRFELQTATTVQAEIINAEGKKVQTIRFENPVAQSGQVAFDVSGLDTGVYFLVFRAQGQTKTIPLLVQHD